jgi:hypothetical protein
MRIISACLVSSVILFATLSSARAGEFTDVIDAFDQGYNGDPFDLRLSVGYEHVYKAGDIRRESITTEPHNWDYYDYIDVARFKQTTNILNLDLDIGIFHDISLRMRLPVILSDERSLSTKSGFSWGDYGDGESLFSTNFQSPKRSGIDTFNVGLWWGILDQGRDDTKPNWTVYAEGHFAAGKEMHAACKSQDGASCSGDTFDDGTKMDSSPVGRGIHEVEGGFRLSRRFKMVEPYFGLDALIGFSSGGNDYFIEGDTAAMLNTRPPAVGTIDVGFELVPWEVPEKERKLVIGVGTGGKYHSEGRDRTPLYDALGTSPYFLGQSSVDFNGNGELDEDINEDSAVQPGVWTGATDVENYATIFGKIFIAVQPAKYVKFRIGSNFMHETEHFITKTDQCSSDQMMSDGTCSQYNWGYRPELDTPGQRFRAEKTFVWDFFIDAAAQF